MALSLSMYCAFLLFVLCQFSSAVPQSSDASEAGSGCEVLASTYPNITSFPGVGTYSNLSSEVWSETCLLSPTCVFAPATAEDVAGAIQILTRTQTQFAVRGGGHMPNPGAAAIASGVLFAMNGLNEMQLTNNNTIAQVGPGLRWGTVYEWISQYNMAVDGGRYYPVGVPGFLLGGGINYWGSQFGWSANMVANFQVVLGNGSIVNANSATNPDLFWALKGGSSNYGIVTRFDLKTFAFPGVYGGITTYEPSSLDAFLNATANFCTADGGSSDIYTHVNPSTTYNAADGSLTLVTVIAHTGPNTNSTPESISAYRALPFVTDDVSYRKSLNLYVNETASASFSSRTTRTMFRMTSLKAGPEAVYLTNKTFFDTIASMPALRNATGVRLTGTHQTLTTAMFTAARNSGGDPIDLDPANGNIVAYLISSAWENPQDDDLVRQFNEQCMTVIEAQAHSQNLYYDFKFLNDSPDTIPVFQAYGGGKSLPRMQSIAKAYDPDGVFQTLMPGGFKLFSQAAASESYTMNLSL